MRQKLKYEFYVLVRNEQVLSVNWAAHGKNSVYVDYAPEPGDLIKKVVEVKKRKRKKVKS